MSQGLKSSALLYYPQSSILFNALEFTMLLSISCINQMLIYAVSESFENSRLGKKFVQNEEGDKSRIAVLCVRIAILAVAFLLSISTSNLEVILDFCGTQFCSFANYIVPVRYFLSLRGECTYIYRHWFLLLWFRIIVSKLIIHWFL